MIKEMGYCTGIENYSRIIERRPIGSAPATLLDYFPDDFLVVVDESHVTLPQIKGMSHGDAARKKFLLIMGLDCLVQKITDRLKMKNFLKKSDKKYIFRQLLQNLKKKHLHKLLNKLSDRQDLLIRKFPFDLLILKFMI